MPHCPGVLLVVLVGAVAEISFVKIDIARLCREVYRIQDDRDLGRWARSLTEALVLRDPSLNEYGAALLAEVEKYREIDAKRKKISKDSTESKDSKDSTTNKQTNKQKRSPARRERDQIFDTVQDLFFPEGVMPGQGSRIGKIVRDLKSIDATPEQIRTRTENMRRLDWGRTAGPEGLLKQWGNLRGAEKPIERPFVPVDPNAYDHTLERDDA